MEETPAVVTGTCGVVLFLLPIIAGLLLGREKKEPDPTGEGPFAFLTPSERANILLEEWKQVTGMQMHFNDMIIRMRTLAVSVVISVFGAAGFAIGQFEDRFVHIAGEDVHVAAIVIAFGLVLWLTIFIIDYGYYYKLLVGSVRRGWQIDDAFRTVKLFDGMHLFGAARLISEAIGPIGASKYFVWTFYGLVYFTGLVYLVAVLIVLDPA
ncbi:MAG: hypothetical protein A2Y61_06165 [Chloroflexi bacterium RBG_13_60_13]|nr:MAG: hypothetical protein A2Y61_06165 [Chloroflexi bacterium RBG_13_60_13]